MSRRGIFTEKEFNEYIAHSEGKEALKSYNEYLEDHEKECVLCGSDNAVFEIRQINDGKYMYIHRPILVLCHMCITRSDSFVSLFNTLLRGN